MEIRSRSLIKLTLLEAKLLRVIRMIEDLTRRDRLGRNTLRLVDSRRVNRLPRWRLKSLNRLEWKLRMSPKLLLKSH
jgi:hypothetical protein